MERTLFGTDGIRGRANSYPMTPDLMLKLGKAAALTFANKNGRSRILIGKDTRISGYILETALTSGICSMGVDVLLVGPLPTPAIAHLTKSFNADAGIVISASHNPAEDNGVKFFSRTGVKLPDHVELELEKLIFSKEIETSHITGKKIGKATRIDDAKGRYIEYAKNTIKNQSFKKLKIVIDCAHGAAYAVAPTIFKELGAELIVLNNKPDGMNINLNCGAAHPEIISKTVKKHRADLGIAFDGDADRVIMVDEKGEIVNGDHIMAIIGVHLLKKNKLHNNTIVATQYSNLALDKLMEKHGGRVIRVENGDRYVIEEMLKHNYCFGGERSGHIINGLHSTTGDGIIAALQILDILKQKRTPLSKLKKILVEYPNALLNVKVKKKVPFNEMPHVREAIINAEDTLNNKGRLLIRYSGTENIARIMVEGKTNPNRLAKEIAKKIRAEIGA